VYLSEAEWRAGEEQAADRAADIALEAAKFQGSNHLLLAALADFPSVAWRRVEAEAAADSAWHRFARLLRSSPAGNHTHLQARAPGVVEVLEFGATELIVEGCPIRPRLTKAHTLLALLATKDRHETTRQAAIQDLFDSGTDQSTVSYLRLAVRSARETLPHGVELTLDRQVIRCTPAESLTSESARFETSLANARSHAGADRLGALLSALDLHRRGPYLERDSSPWAHARRRDLDDLAEEALIDASATAYDLAEYGEAERLVREGLTRNRFRESAWRLLMRIAAATHDHDAVIAAYRECESAVAEFGAQPSAATVAMLAQLRA
jgi:DNA-binding SARP family transcriptional activator